MQRACEQRWDARERGGVTFDAPIGAWDAWPRMFFWCGDGGASPLPGLSGCPGFSRYVGEWFDPSSLAGRWLCNDLRDIVDRGYETDAVACRSFFAGLRAFDAWPIAERWLDWYIPTHDALMRDPQRHPWNEWEHSFVDRWIRATASIFAGTREWGRVQQRACERAGILRRSFPGPETFAESISRDARLVQWEDIIGAWFYQEESESFWQPSSGMEVEVAAPGVLGA